MAQAAARTRSKGTFTVHDLCRNSMHNFLEGRNIYLTCFNQALIPWISMGIFHFTFIIAYEDYFIITILLLLKVKTFSRCFTKQKHTPWNSKISTRTISLKYSKSKLIISKIYATYNIKPASVKADWKSLGELRATRFLAEWEFQFSLSESQHSVQ